MAHFFHYRFGSGEDTQPRGGATIAYTLEDVADSTHKRVNFAVAWCSPKDAYVKARGRELALSRLGSEHSFRVLGSIAHDPAALRKTLLIHAITATPPRWVIEEGRGMGMYRADSGRGTLRRALLSTRRQRHRSFVPAAKRK